ncbi:MAG: hypothetical protein WC275_01930 [Bacilli bacterium]
MKFFRKDSLKRIEREVNKLYSDEKKFIKYGKGQVYAHREKYLNRYGNPVYQVAYFNHNGEEVASVKTTGPAVRFLDTKIAKVMSRKKKK